MPTTIRTVIIPAAGRGTRLFPLTKVTPKELLPIYDRPVLHFAVAEALASGAERVVIVVHPTKTAICDYVTKGRPDIHPMPSDGMSDRSAIFREKSLANDADVVFVMQSSPLGLGHAVLCCSDVVLPGPIGIILPDDVIMGESCLIEMAQDYAGGHMVAAMDVDASETSHFGIFTPTGQTHRRCVPATGMVEKPKKGNAASNLAAVGRYLLDPVVMQTLASTKPGKGNEVQLTDAIAQDALDVGLTAFRFSGARYDCGSLDGLIEAGVARREMLKQREKYGTIEGHHDADKATRNTHNSSAEATA